MSDERKPMCPMGHEMAVRARRIAASTTWQSVYYCHCGWQAPVGVGETEQEAIEAAYLAATRTPPNRPLTNAQVMGMSGLDAVWIVNTSHIGIKPVAWLQQELRDVFADVWSAKKLFFAAPPTPEDIAAARKERNNE